MFLQSVNHSAGPVEEHRVDLGMDWHLVTQGLGSTDHVLGAEALMHLHVVNLEGVAWPSGNSDCSDWH